ncbi:MAG: SagB-type dehydrogenase domain protein [Desulfonauticus sp. 38_4375]|nr:MAG: SagB-type dehydrogenase domain protein [Desulfonauticus sp. 38_4375]
MPDLKKSWGWQYWQKTKFKREELPFWEPLRIGPEKKKTEDQVAEIFLPAPQQDDFLELVKKRRSQRRFKDEFVDLKNLSYLLYAGYGVSGRAGFYALKTAPSAGALYPCQLYVVARKVSDLEPGVYFFEPEKFKLEQKREGDFSSNLAKACLDQSFVGKAAFNIVLSAVFRRNMIKYGHRGLRYILLDAGHIAQNILLAATHLGLGACPVAAFFDEEVDNILQINGEEESTLYLLSVGKS